MSLTIEFKIKSVKRYNADHISEEALFHNIHDIKPIIEERQAMKAYRNGFIILDMEWLTDIENGGLNLYVTVGKVIKNE